MAGSPLDPRATDAIDPGTRAPAAGSEYERRLDALERALALTPSGSPPSPGDLKMIAYAAAPLGWLLANGQAVSRTTFSLLFAAIGTTYGVGDGSTTFNVPDLVGRFPIGSGTAANPTPGGATAHALGAKGGEETHQLVTANMPGHSHDSQVTNFGAFTAGTNRGFNYGSGTNVNADPSFPGNATSRVGGDGRHNNLPPFTVVSFAIKT